MAKNLIPQIAKMLGVEIGEIFTLKGSDGEKMSGEYMIHNNGLLYRYDEDHEWQIAAVDLMRCLNGEVTVVKLPYKPKYGEAYCTYATDDDKWVVNCKIWTDWVTEFAALKCGVVFRTREEAEAALPAKYEELTGKKWSEENEELNL